MKPLIIFPNPGQPLLLQLSIDRGDHRALGKRPTVQRQAPDGGERTARLCQNQTAGGIVPHPLTAVQVKLNPPSSQHHSNTQEPRFLCAPKGG